MSDLVWRQPDQYHIATACGRFTVARVRVQDVDQYVAYRREPSLNVARARELGRAFVPPRATDAERMTAIRAMKKVCADASLSL